MIRNMCAALILGISCASSAFAFPPQTPCRFDGQIEVLPNQDGWLELYRCEAGMWVFVTYCLPGEPCG